MKRLNLIISALERYLIYADCILADADEGIAREALAAARELRDVEPAGKLRLLAALERACAAESALRRLVDECENENPGWEDRMLECIVSANKLLSAQQEQPEFDTPESHIVKWSIPVDPNNFGEALAQPEQKFDYPPECTTPEMELAYAAGWWKALEVQRNKQQALDKKADNARELGLDYEVEPEPFEYWNAVEGWVKIDEIRKHFEMVGCGTIYKTTGEGMTPLYTAPQKPKWVSLSELEARNIFKDIDWDSEDWACISYARAIEAACREKNGRTDSHTGGGATGSGRAWASGGVDDHDPI